MQVTISPKFQVVIPKEIRTRLKLRPGQRVYAVERDDSVVLIPVVPIEELRVQLRGIDTDVEPEDDPA